MTEISPAAAATTDPKPWLCQHPGCGQRWAREPKFFDLHGADPVAFAPRDRA